MAEKEKTTRPSMGSNELDEETELVRGKGMPAGTDTQTQLAALSTENKNRSDKKNKEVEGEKFPEAGETDE